ncbi:hypothetical protein K1X76_08365 [bacterium]|nr:hypothetical protein [bacterium]
MPKKEKYRLEPLLKVKERARRTAEIALAKAIKLLKQEQEKLELLKGKKTEIEEKKENTKRDLRSKVSEGGLKIRQSEFHFNFIRKLDEDIESVSREIKDQEDVVAEADKKLKRAKRDYIDAATELDVMKKHKELWTKKLTKKLSDKENKEMGELGNVLFQITKGREGAAG